MEIKINAFKLIPYIVIAVLGILLVYTNDKAKRVATQLESTKAVASYWKDNAGRSNAEIAVLRVENFKDKKIADSLRSLDIKPKTVTQVVTIKTHSVDTVTIYKGRPFGNKWATFNINNNLLTYNFTDSIALVTYSKRVGLFKPRVYTTRAISFNPYTTLTGITSTEILPKERRFSIGGYAGYGLQFGRDGVIRHGWSTGVGINFRIF